MTKITFNINEFVGTPIEKIKQKYDLWLSIVQDDITEEKIGTLDYSYCEGKKKVLQELIEDLGRLEL
ncbi:MAG TPA: hypothetical protein VLA74_01125 [Nitrososphaeraceae archaeon]|nr:hypothetical protein [Nitrososphaeraceae archaeon]